MNRVRSTLKSMEGVLAHEVGVDDNSLLIAFQERVTNPAKIMAQLAQQGYQIAGQREVTAKMPCN